MSVPPREVAEAAVAALVDRRDQKIVIHCDGGLGRSGVIVGCLLRRLGLSWPETERRLHAARGPRCPETPEQRRFVAAF